jgi:hypothetical protein
MANALRMHVSYNPVNTSFIADALVMIAYDGLSKAKSRPYAVADSSPYVWERETLSSKHPHASPLGAAETSYSKPNLKTRPSRNSARYTENTNLGSIKLPAATRRFLDCRFSQVPHVIDNGNTVIG